MTVADIVADGLWKAGTHRIFAASAAMDSIIGRAARRRGLQIVRASGDAAACIMAAVAGELTGVPGIAVVRFLAEAPGVLDAVASAYWGRSPLVLVTGHAASGSVHHVSLITSATKSSVVVTAESAAHAVAHASQLARTAPRGPVHLAIADDTASQSASPVAVECRLHSLPAPEASALDAAARLISDASHPVVVVGLECRSEGDTSWLRAFAEALPAPVLVTPKAKGVIPDPHPLSLGMFTRDGPENALFERVDLIVAIGVDAVESEEWKPRGDARVVHIGLSPCEGEHYRPALEVIGDIGLILEELAPRLRNRGRADWDVAALDRMKRDFASQRSVSLGGLTPYRVVQLARELTPGGTIAAFDAGPELMSLVAAWQAVAPNELLIPSAATINFALPAAVATQLIYPERRVVCVTGACAAISTSVELQMIARLGLPIVVVALTDAMAPPESFEGAITTVVLFEANSGSTFRAAFSQALQRNVPALVRASPRLI